MKNFILIPFVLISSLVQGQGAVDGYFKGKNVCDIAFSGAYQHSDKYVRGDMSDIIDYTRKLVIMNLFAEYGISDKFDVIATIPFINGKFQDMGIYAKYRLLHFNQTNLSVIPALGISFPMSNYQTQTGQAIGQRATVVQPKLVIQWQKEGFFVQAQGGYNLALDPAASSVPASVKFGWAGNNMYTDIWFDYQYGIGGTNYTSSVIDFRTLGVSHQRIGGVFYYAFKPKFGAFLNGAYVLSGRNTGLGSTVGAGVVVKLSP